MTTWKFKSCRQQDSTTPLETIARKVGVPKSTAHYRVRRLQQTRAIEHHAKVSTTKVGNYLVVVLVREKYGLRYHERIGRRIAAIPEVYCVLGDK